MDEPVVRGASDLKAARRVLKRTPSKKGTGRIATAPLPEPEPEYSGYHPRRRHY